jgi:hypothetical protein
LPLEGGKRCGTPATSRFAHRAEPVATVSAFLTVGFSTRKEPTLRKALSVATSLLPASLNADIKNQCLGHPPVFNFCLYTQERIYPLPIPLLKERYRNPCDPFYRQDEAAGGSYAESATNRHLNPAGPVKLGKVSEELILGNAEGLETKRL